MEMQRGPRGLRDREYPDDVQGHVGSVDEAEQPAEGSDADQPTQGSDEVEGHLARPNAIGDQLDDRER